MTWSSWLNETANKIASIKTGYVTYVNPETHVYDVFADDGTKYPKIPLMSPYVCNSNGQGYTAVPRFGSRCVIGVSENKEAFIMGFIVPVGLKPSPTAASVGPGVTQEQSAEVAQRQANSYEGRSGNRDKKSSIDDQKILGPNGNYVSVLASGAIEAVADEGLILTRWIPGSGGNVILSVAENIETRLPSGQFEWKTNYKEGTGFLLASVKSLLDQNPDILVKLGQPPDDDPDKDNRVTISITPPAGTDGSSNTVKISVSSSGEVKIESKNLTISSTETVKVNCKNANIKAESRVKISGNSIDLV